MAFFTTTVTGLYRLVNRSLGLRTIAGDMAKAATIVAFDTICLAVLGIVIETTALVTDHATASTITATISTTISSTTTRTTTISTSTSTTGTVTSQMTKTVAIIAATTRTAAVYANIGAVGLKVTNATARITLFSVGSSRLRALIGLVTRLLAIITKPFRFRASVSKMTDVAALETALFSERHFFRQTKNVCTENFSRFESTRGK